MPRRQLHSSPRTRAPPPPSHPSIQLRLIAGLISTLPFLFLSTPTRLLFPLFSSAPATAATEATYPLYLTLGVTFLASHLFFRRREKAAWTWRVWWVSIGGWKIVSEALVRLGGEGLLGIGLERGVLVGRALLEAVPVWSLCSWVWSSLTCKERSAFLPRWFIPTAFIASLLPPVHRLFSFSSLPFVSECHILQVHGILLASIALFAPYVLPSKQQAQVRTPRSSPPRYKQKQPVQRKPIVASSSSLLPPPHSAHLSFRLRLGVFTGLIALAYIASLTSTHCPTSASTPRLRLPRAWLSSSPFTDPPPPRILSSHPSVTGQIVVGEQTVPGPVGEDGKPQMMEFRYLRADHSLLGGLWVGPSREERRKESVREGRGEKVDEREVVGEAETIYSTFLLQELVRLVKPPPDLPRQSPEQGLIIGLGAGLSARALDMHDVNLTICEIDPKVYEAASEWFGVEDPTRRKGWGEVVLRDAVAWVEEQRGRGKLFDYIIHDVFTGGALPSSLFTFEFWSSLRSLLHTSGVLAVNFAGSLGSTSTRLILSTLLASFPHCRAFQDVPVSHKEKKDDHNAFKNFVIFCTNSWSIPVEFRAPLPEDYLPDGPSPAIRRRVFDNYAGQEVDLSRFRFDQGAETDTRWRGREKARWMFRKGMEGRVEKEQLEEVRAHWEAMGQVLPARAWAEW
ncbi:hypothetical protein JCM11251_002674 [Rhodosporidiobolus azoricus]